jgi:hypothetical protein
MHIDALRLRALEHGCDTCHATCSRFRAVQFSILPARLKRKRHKERERTAVYCLNCYDSSESLPVTVDGQLLRILKSAANDEEFDMRCLLCAIPYRHGELYGQIISTKWHGSSPEESHHLGIICENCLETHKIGLAGNISAK